MSAKRHKKNIRSKYLTWTLVLLILGLGSLAVLEVVSWHNDDDEIHEHPATMDQFASADPLPGDLVRQTLSEDSVHSVRMARIRSEMGKVISGYQKQFRHEYFTGYFLTDLDKDGLPELWVKVGNYRDNSKLELFYPMPDGSLLKSDTFSEPGQYYLGDDYIMQVVSSGPGYININKISLYNGMMNVENIRGIDLYEDPEASIPTFAEREIRDSSFSNLATLDRALRF